MPTLLMGHGGVMTDQAITLPDGWTMSFLIDEARIMPFSNGVGVVMNIDTLQNEGFALASQHRGGEQIHNHVLHVLTSNQRSWYAQVDPEDGSCRYAGEHFPDGARLCEDPGPDGECANNPGGTHTCGGILSMTWPDPNLVWVSCRQDLDPNVRSKPQFTFGSEANDPTNVEKTEFVDFATDAEKRLRENPDGFATYFDSLTDEQVAQLLYKLPIRQWTFQRQAHAFLNDGATDEQFYAFIEGQDDTDRGLYMRDRDLRAAWERGKVVRTARDYLDSAGATNFVLYVNEMDPTERALVESYPDLAALLDVGDDDPLSAESQSAKYGMTVDEIDWSMVQAVNEKAIKDTPNNGDVAFWQLPAGEILIGKDQQPETYRKLIELVRDQGAVPTGDKPNGTIKVTKGGAFSKGGLAVTGATNQDRMRALIKEFSDKTVTFA